MNCRKLIACLLVALILLTMLAGCNRTESQPKTPQYNTVEDLTGKRIGVVTGMIFDKVAEENIPDCKVSYYLNCPDMAEALSEGKIDAFIVDEPIARRLVVAHPGQEIIAQVIYEDGTPEQIFDNPQKERTRRFIRHLKVFETVIDGADFDFVGIVSELDQYAYKNELPPQMVYRLRALFEELCHELLLPAIEQKLINFTVEYDSEAQLATAIITYPGKSYDPSTSDNKISLAIINNLAESIQYSFHENDDFCNKITVCVK